MWCRAYKHGILYTYYPWGKKKRTFDSIDFHLWFDHFLILYGFEKFGIEIDLKNRLFQFVFKFFNFWKICFHFQFKIPDKFLNIDFTIIKTCIQLNIDFFFFSCVFRIFDDRHDEYDCHTDIFEYQKKFDQLYPARFYKGKESSSRFYFDFYDKEKSKRFEQVYKHYLSTTLFRIYNDDFLNSPHSITLELTLPFMNYISFGFIQPWDSGRYDCQGWKYLGFHIGMCDHSYSNI